VLREGALAQPSNTHDNAVTHNRKDNGEDRVKHARCIVSFHAAHPARVSRWWRKRAALRQPDARNSSRLR
jgi:hypothetical protein